MVLALSFLGLLYMAVTDAFTFFAVGDWEGREYPLYSTNEQIAATIGMDRVSKEIGADFMLTLGDNFYLSGVRNEYDPRFKSTFEDVYTGSYLQFPWYVMAGNHDWEGNVSAQIAYSQHSNRWKFPANYYANVFTDAKDGLVFHLIVINVVDLDSKSYDRMREYWQWLEGELSSSKADFILIAGDFPIYAINSTYSYARRTSQAIVDEIWSALYQHHYFLSYMGLDCCYNPNNLRNVPHGLMQWYIANYNKPRDLRSGFSSFNVRKAGGMVVSYHDQDGKVLYATPSIAVRDNNNTNKQGEEKMTDESTNQNRDL